MGAIGQAHHRAAAFQRMPEVPLDRDWPLLPRVRRKDALMNAKKVKELFRQVFECAGRLVERGATHRPMILRAAAGGGFDIVLCHGMEQREVMALHEGMGEEGPALLVVEAWVVTEEKAADAEAIRRALEAGANVESMPGSKEAVVVYLRAPRGFMRVAEFKIERKGKRARLVWEEPQKASRLKAESFPRRSSDSRRTLH